MPTYPVLRFVQRHQGEPVELFLGVVPARELINRAKIDVYDPRSKHGYQREPSQVRAQQIARYVLAKEGMMPTAVLVNLRSSARFQPGTDGSGLLSISNGEAFWVMDGQHRYEGLKVAQQALDKRGKGEQLEYDVPVVFCLNFEQERERGVFKIVNSTAKSVDTGLLAELEAQRVMATPPEQRVNLLSLRKTVGLDIAHYLNDTAGPWQKRIRLANEPKGDVSKRPVQINTMASSLRTFLREGWVQRSYENSRDFRRLAQMVAAFWAALQELMPEAFEQVETHAVQRPLGIYVFHSVMCDVFDRCRSARDWSRGFMRQQLETLGPWVQSQTWNLDSGEPIVRSSVNAAAIGYVLAQMRSYMGVEAPGLEVEEELPA